MAFCANCGAEVQGRFCAKCGAAVAGAGPAQGSAAPPPPQPNYTAPQQSYAQPMAQASGLTDNMAAALCYILGLVTGILFLVLAPYNQNRAIRFHAFQSIFFHVAAIVVFLALGVVTGILHVIPFVGQMLAAVLYPLCGLAFFILWLMLMYKAYNNERWVLPVIGPLAEKQA